MLGREIDRRRPNSENEEEEEGFAIAAAIYLMYFTSEMCKKTSSYVTVMRPFNATTPHVTLKGGCEGRKRFWLTLFYLVILVQSSSSLFLTSDSGQMTEDL